MSHSLKRNKYHIYKTFLRKLWMSIFSLETCQNASHSTRVNGTMQLNLQTGSTQQLSAANYSTQLVVRLPRNWKVKNWSNDAKYSLTDILSFVSNSISPYYCFEILNIQSYIQFQKWCIILLIQSDHTWLTWKVQAPISWYLQVVAAVRAVAVVSGVKKL